MCPIVIKMYSFLVTYELLIRVINVSNFHIILIFNEYYTQIVAVFDETCRTETDGFLTLSVIHSVHGAGGAMMSLPVVDSTSPLDSTYPPPMYSTTPSWTSHPPGQHPWSTSERYASYWNVCFCMKVKKHVAQKVGDQRWIQWAGAGDGHSMFSVQFLSLSCTVYKEFTK